MNLIIGAILHMNKEANHALDDAEFHVPPDTQETAKNYKSGTALTKDMVEVPIYTAVVVEYQTFENVPVKNKRGKVVSREALPF